MKPIEINLSDPFEKTLEHALSLPKRSEEEHEEAIAQALRCLYTRAHGRIVETIIGPITVVPPADSSLTGARLLLVKRGDLLALAKQKTNFRGHAARINRNPGTAAFMPVAFGPPSATRYFRPPDDVVSDARPLSATINPNESS